MQQVIDAGAHEYDVVVAMRFEVARRYAEGRWNGVDDLTGMDANEWPGLRRSILFQKEAWLSPKAGLIAARARLHKLRGFPDHEVLAYARKLAAETGVLVAAPHAGSGLAFFIDSNHPLYSGPLTADSVFTWVP